jgi:hypothetical protein
MKGLTPAGTKRIILFSFLLLFAIFTRALDFRLTLPQIIVGGTAELTGRAVSNATVIISVTGPAAVPTRTLRAGRDGSFASDIGPFTTAGDYTITAASGSERKTLQLKVSPPAYSMTEPLGSLGSAFVQATDSSDQSLTAVKGGLDAIPGNNADIKKAKEDVDQVRRTLPDIRRGMESFAEAERRFEETLLSEPNLQKESMQEYEGFLRSTGQSIREQSERLIALGREASGGQTDACVAVALAAAALNAEKSLMEMMKTGLKDYLTDWAKSADISGAQSLPTWLKPIQDRFLNGLRSRFEPPSPEEQVASRTGAPEAESVVSRWTIVKSLFGAAKSFMEGGPWAAAKSLIDDAVDVAIDAYTETHCLVFKGKISGHTHVEALDNGRPMYGLDNDWEGDAQLMCAKPSGREPVAFRGYLAGKAKNFKVTNGLRSLYEGRPGNFKYLTGLPSLAAQLSAVFMVPLEGTVAGDKLAIKARKGGIDFDGRVIAKLAVVIIPTGSPVPQVQKYDTPYQPGWWQVTRALGEGGMTTLQITMSDDKRRANREWSRDLSSAGAKGTFRIKVELCAGCED